MSTRRTAHPWQFRARFRRHAFGWRSQPAITRVKEAVSEIRKVARTDQLLAAEGAVLFLEKVSPALEQVDSSSGAIGTAVNRAIDVLVGIIASAPADAATRDQWLERLFQAHADDGIPYIEVLADHWGDLCASPEVASRWADDLIDITRRVLSPQSPPGHHFHGATACLSALYAAGRYDELLDLARGARLWHYRQWAVKALVVKGEKAEALRYAETCRDPWTSDLAVDRVCEEILLSSGFVDEAYRRYGLTANRAGTYLAWFRAVAKNYPHKEKRDILADLVERTPGEEGKWFAAAKDAGMFDEAIALANASPCAPQTLTRAARDYAEKNPAFALEAGMAALRWLVEGYGYEITGFDVIEAYSHTMKAADCAGHAHETHARIRELVARDRSPGGFVMRMLGGKVGLT